MKYISHYGLLTDYDSLIIERELLIAKKLLVGCVVEEYSAPWKDCLYV